MNDDGYQEGAARRLARSISVLDGIHQFNTLTPAKIRMVEIIHDFAGLVDLDQLAQASGWTVNYVYRLTDDLAAAGILVMEHGGSNRHRRFFQCSCTINEEEFRS